MTKQDPVVHFEMGYNDRERMKMFYSTVFGWKMNQMGQDMGEYVVAQTGPTDDKTTRPTEPGFINGGFYAKAGPASQAPSVVISVDDIKAAIEEVKKAGGKILGGMMPGGTKTMEPTEIPGVGLWISFEDPESNRASMLQPKM